jgi:WD40 repeat protein
MLVGHTNPVVSAWLDHGGTRVASASSDMTARIWRVGQLTDLRGAALVDYVCSNRLKGVLQVLTASDVDSSSALLAGGEGNDVCSVPTLFDRIGGWLAFSSSKSYTGAR